MEKKSRLPKRSKPNISNNHITKSLIAAGHSNFPFGITESGDKYLDNLSIQMITDCLDESKKFMSITQWCLHVGLYPQDLENYKERNETFRKAFNVAQSAIGERRENELRSGAPSALAWVLPQFNKTWKAERDERATLKANLEGKGNTELHVHIEPTPSTDIVKPRVIEKESE